MPLFIQSLAASTANVLAASIFQGLLIVLAVALCLRLFPSIPAAARSFIWTSVFVLVLVLPFVPHPHGTAASTHALTISPAWSYSLATLWLTLSLVRATRLVLSALTLRRLARTATPVAIPSSSFSLSAAPLLCTSPLVDRPSVVGFFSRRILLPTELYTSLAPAELHQVLLHETEHLRRRDDWTNLLQKIALVLVPLNPVLLWVERRLCLERELACDDLVLRVTGAPRAYASCLTHLAEHRLLRRSLTLALGFFERQSELTRRVHRILLAPQQAMSPRQTFAATSTLLVVLVGGSLQLAHAPEFIRFASPPTQAAELATAPVVPGAPTFRNASFHTSDPSAARPTLLKAIMPAPASRHSASKPRGKHTVRLQQPRINAVRALQADFSYDDASGPPRLFLAAARYTRVSYTYVPAVAVATPNGWIIFNL